MVLPVQARRLIPVCGGIYGFLPYCRRDGWLQAALCVGLAVFWGGYGWRVGPLCRGYPGGLSLIG